MSLTSSISNAFSGLTVTSRAAQLVSSNLANALNENYSRQEIELGSSQNGGAFLANTNRIVDIALIADRRNAMSGVGLATVRTDGARALEQTIGMPGDASSLPAHINRFDAALLFLESDPGSEVRLRDVLSTASSLTGRLNDAEADIQVQRMQADRQIASAVDTLNTSLNQIVTLNEKIVEANVNGRNTSSFLDQRQSLIDQVSELIPVREMRRSHDSISLVSANGMMLIDHSAINIEFSKSNLIMPHMLVENGDLGTLQIDGDQYNLGDDNGPLSGGRLQALFELRDKSSVQLQSQLDAFALDLSARFQDLPSDILAPPSSPGLFTDNGALANAIDELGLAGRLKVNVGVDPAEGGELWRLRGGLHALSETPKGEAALVSDMITRLGESRATFGSAFDHIATISSNTAQLLSSRENEQSFSNAQFTQLNQMHLVNGVDTDSELQKLLRIETNYAANAKVMQTIDEMFSAILRIN